MRWEDSIAKRILTGQVVEVNGAPDLTLFD